jgi:hypothetical protein
MPVMLIGFSSLMVVAEIKRRRFLSLVDSFWWVIVIYWLTAGAVTFGVFSATVGSKFEVW